MDPTEITELKPFICKSCPSIFNEESALKAHQMIHAKEEPNHIFHIKEEQPYQCDSCPSAFCCERDRDDHYWKAHVGVDNPFRCKFCQSAFHLIFVTTNLLVAFFTSPGNSELFCTSDS